jgi:dTDP-4-dehydrorhamnose 3,5-epimerase
MDIIVIKVGKGFADKRGLITPILDDTSIGIKSILYIKSKKGSTRGEHYHKRDNHYIYCIFGKFIYSQSKPPFSKITSVILKPGDLVFTPATHWHSMEYLEDSVMLAFATEPRKQNKYENDTFRLKINDQK